MGKQRKKRAAIKVAAALKQNVSVPAKTTVCAFYSNYSKPMPVAPKFVAKVRELEKEMKQPVVLLWQGERPDATDDETIPAYMDDYAYSLFAHNINKLKAGKKVVVIVRSPGGAAGSAFKLATLLRKHCGGYIVAVPFWAKSAATLFALGADKIIMSRFAEFGPLDSQVRSLNNLTF